MSPPKAQPNPVPPTEALRLATAATGTTPRTVLGAGMEGVAVALDEDRVAKVWHAADPVVLERLTHLHTALADHGLPFATPRTHAVHRVEDRWVTVEDRLVGTDLSTLVAQGRLDPTTAQGHVVEVVAALAAAGPLAAAGRVPVLGEEPPSGEGADALAALAHRRAGPALAAAVAHLPALLEALAPRLREVATGTRVAVHGDLVPANVLLGGDGRVSAVLDWGFLTTEGEPALEAAVAAAGFDMYSPDALTTELALLDRLGERLGIPRTTLLVHRAAYSVITATAFDPAGRDGHFAWCVAALHRPDVLAAVLGRPHP